MAPSNILYFEDFDGVKKLLELKRIARGVLEMEILFSLAYVIDKENNDCIVSTNGKHNLVFPWQVNAYQFR